MLWRSGLRISEALALELRDVDIDAGNLRVRHGKGDRSRTVGSMSRPPALLASTMVTRIVILISGFSFGHHSDQ